VLAALKLAVSRAPPPARAAPGPTASADASDDASVDALPPPAAAVAASAALGAAARLADLASAGLPLDAASIAAGIVADAAASGALSVADIGAKLGPDVASLTADVLSLRALPRAVDVYDGPASAALRDAALAAVDGRAAMVEVAARAAALLDGGARAAPAAARAVASLEALQIFAPLGHALGMGGLANEMEDAAFRDLFPRAYAETERWLRREAGAYETLLAAARDEMVDAIATNEALASLAGACEVRVRTKSLFSTMKKLLRLDDLAAGGRDRAALYDLLGMRVIVSEREREPGEAEGAPGEDAVAACYAVRDAAAALWPHLPSRAKDYIAVPKANGYASLHMTLLPGFGGGVVDVGEGGGDGSGGDSDGGLPPPPVPPLELQIRTASMHAAAEYGGAAHTAYKGGMTAEQAARLAEWSGARAALSASSSSDDSDGPDPDDDSSKGSAVSLFRHLDLDGDGTVSTSELAAALADLGADAPAAGAAAAAMLAGASGSGPGGALTLDEFLGLLEQVGERGSSGFDARRHSPLSPDER
jgi:ppGpp synthetase/RelA/SpoT-type nucleotidyltranferase